MHRKEDVTRGEQFKSLDFPGKEIVTSSNKSTKMQDKEKASEVCHDLSLTV